MRCILLTFVCSGKYRNKLRQLVCEDVCHAHLSHKDGRIKSLWSPNLPCTGSHVQLCLAYDLLSHFLGFLLQFLYIYILDFWGLSRFFLTLFYPLLDSSTFFTLKMFYIYIYRYIYIHFSVEHDVSCSKNADIFPSFGLFEWEHLFKSGLCKIQNWQIGSLVFHEFELNWPHSTERWIGI